MVQHWPQAILHVDCDAFFASVIQAMYPQLKGKPIATGAERGVAIAVSYEAKRLGVKRCMPSWEIKKICPECVIVSSDYKLYHIFSKRMFDILRTFTPVVEEYSIDEGFVDITHLPRFYKTDYYGIGKIIKEKIEAALGITVSVGISTSKSLAKIASNYDKPSGLIVIGPNDIYSYLRKLPVQDVWGIGHRIAARLQVLGIATAYEYVTRTEAFIKKHLSKPYIEIWRELHGQMIYKIDPEPHTDYKSMSKIQTFSPPTNDYNLLWARLIDRVEEAFEKARKYNYNVGTVVLFLKTQQFTYQATELKFSEKAHYPFLIRRQLKEGFEKIYKPGIVYRATGCVLNNFEEADTHQASLFDTTAALEKKMQKIYPLYESGQVHFGTSLFQKVDFERAHARKLERKLRIPLLSLS
jgi:DNA polymerase-4/DNA polymerase V